ncbi:hypothetical protein Emag_006492 [Eimeria magna]
MSGGKRAVLDLGTGSIKAGWAGEGKARYILPTCAGAVRRRPQLYLSEECYSLPEYICSRPSQAGLWANLEVLRDLLDLSFGKKYLSADVRELGGLTLTEPLLTPASLRHQISEICFEDLGVERLAIVAAQAVVPYAFWGMAWGALDMCAPPRARRMAVSCYSGQSSHATSLPSQREGGGPAPSSSGSGGGGGPSSAVSKAKGLTAAGSVSSDPCFSPRLAATAAGGAAAEGAAGGHVSPGRNPFCLTVDVGFSASHAVPQVNYSALEAAALRAEIGGAHANAYLKNLLLTRGISLEKNELFAQKLKEETCFITADVMSVLRSLQRLPGGRRAAHLGGPLFVEREMPDYSQTLAAFYHTHSPAPIPDLTPYGSDAPPTTTTSSSSSNGVGGEAAGEGAQAAGQPAEQQPSQGASQGAKTEWAPPSGPPPPARPSVKLSTERIVVPEILFRPQDGGSTECGVGELVYRAICKAPVEAQPFLASQILLVGGSSKFNGFRERLWTELRATLPDHWPINIYQHEDAQHSAWLGASNWSQDDGVYMQFAVSRQQFLETGYA